MSDLPSREELIGRVVRAFGELATAALLLYIASRFGARASHSVVNDQSPPGATTVD